MHRTVGLAVAPCIEDTSCLADKASNLGSSFDTVVRRVREFLLFADLFVSLPRDRVLSAPPGRSCRPLCPGPGLRISFVIRMLLSHSES